MKLSQLTKVAKDAIDKRGGVDAIKQDLQEARQAASGHDNLVDKARAAAGAFKQPGDDHGRAARAATAGQETPDPTAAAGQDPPRAE